MNWYKTAKDSWKRFYKKVKVDSDEIKSFLVDGEYVRDELSIEFALGGHHYVYDFIPEDEIWLEPTEHTRDIEDNLAHECYERKLMKYDKLTYEEAHSKASTFERDKREKEVKENS